jgi:hypothetical protein
MTAAEPAPPSGPATTCQTGRPPRRPARTPSVLHLNSSACQQPRSRALQAGQRARAIGQDRMARLKCLRAGSSRAGARRCWRPGPQACAAGTFLGGLRAGSLRLSRFARRRAPRPGRRLCGVLPAPQPEVQANDDGGDDQNRGEHRRADPYRGAPLSCSDIMGDLMCLRPGMCPRYGRRRHNGLSYSASPGSTRGRGLLQLTGSVLGLGSGLQVLEPGSQ